MLCRVTYIPDWSMPLKRAPKLFGALLALTLFLGPYDPQLLIISFEQGGMVRSQDELSPDDCFTLAAQLHQDYFGNPAPQPRHGVEAIFCIDAPK